MVTIKNREVLTVAEASKLLRISEPTLYREIHKNAIPHVRLGRRILISKTRLMGIFDNHTEEAK